MKWLLFGVLAVAACSQRAQPAPHTDLELIAPGAEPRRAARYAIAKGAKTTFELAMDLNIEAGAFGGALPTFATTMELTCEDVLADGRMKIRTKIVDAVARERPESKMPATAMSSQLELMRGLVITAVLGPDGTLTGATVVPGPKPLPPALEQQIAGLTSSLEQIAMPLPTDPIGVGARWRSTRTLRQNGLMVTTAATVEVTSLDATKLGFAMTSEISGPDQSVKQQGTAIDVKHIRGSGQGKGTLDLTTLAMAAELSAKFESQMAAQGQETPMQVDMKLTMTPK